MHMTIARVQTWVAWRGVRLLERQAIRRAPKSLRAYLIDSAKTFTTLSISVLVVSGAMWWAS